MFSFRVKLVIALIGLSLVSFAFGTFYTRTLLLEYFENIILDRSSDGFRYDVIAYLNHHGSWENALKVETFEQYRAREGRQRPRPSTTPIELPRFVATDLEGKIWVAGTTEEFALGNILPDIILENSIPLKNSGVVIGHVLADGEMLPTDIEENYLQGLKHTWWVSLLLVAGISVPLGYFLGGRLTKPINNLISAISNMSPANLAQQVPVSSKDELGILTLSFNQMSTDLADFVHVIKKQKEKISKTEKLLRQGLINISHELRTPLYTTIFQAYAMIDGVRELDKKQLKKLASSLDHLSHLVDDLHQLSVDEVKDINREFEIVDFCPIIRNCLDSRKEVFAEKGFSLTVDIPEKCRLDGDKTRLRQIMDNLLSNCVKYSNPNAQIRIELQNRTNSIEFTLYDNGPGLPSEDLDLLFERFYKSDQSNNQGVEGLGLGLSIVKTCTEIHGGEVSAFISKEGGLGIAISIPISTDIPDYHQKNA